MMDLSIITINYNDVEGFNTTMRSVTPQLDEGIEWIVIDGGSTDGSKEAIEHSKDKISYWVSEPDRGIYHAMNKGIDRAKGEYVLFLNSGDYLNPDINLRECLDEMGNSDFEVFDIMISHDGEIKYTKALSAINETPIMYFLIEDTFPHQSTLIRRKLFDTYGRYDETVKISSDWAFYIKAFISGSPTYHYNQKTLSIYDDEGISTTTDPLKLAQERQSILETVLSRPILDAILQGKSLYTLRSQICKYRFNAVIIKCLLKISSILGKNVSKD